MNYERIDQLESIRYTLSQEARRCASDAAYVDFLYHEWRHYSVRLENEWRRAEGSSVVPPSLREGRARRIDARDGGRRL